MAKVFYKKSGDSKVVSNLFVEGTTDEVDLTDDQYDQVWEALMI